jgi:hypothetical protein
MIRRAREGTTDQPSPADAPEPAVTAEPPTEPDPGEPEPVADEEDGAALLPEHFQVEAPAASGSSIRWGVIIGIGVVAFLVFRWITADTPVDDLAVGDCFMAPTEEEIETVETVDCSDLHDYEVFAFVTLDDGAGGYPGDVPLFEQADERCFQPFLDYVGDETAASPDVYYDVFIPGESSWDAGNRESMCAIFTVGDGFDLVHTEGSLRRR